MASRPPIQQKQLNSRFHGLMKKANELYKRHGVRVAVLMEDGAENWAYQSEEAWPSSHNIPERGRQFFPSDFITLSEYQRRSAASSEASSAAPGLPAPLLSTLPSESSHDFKDEDLALFQALGSRYPNMEAVVPEPVVMQTSYGLKIGSKRPLAQTADSSTKKARRVTEPTNSRPTTRSESKHGHEDPYNFAS